MSLAAYAISFRLERRPPRRPYGSVRRSVGARGMPKRTTGASGKGSHHDTNRLASRAPPSKGPAIASTVRDRLLASLAETVGSGSVRAARISIRASPMSRRRSPLSFCKHRRRSSWILAGILPGNAFQSGSRSTILAIVSVTVSPMNAGLPVSASYQQHPNAQMSVRLSTLFPRAARGSYKVPCRGSPPRPFLSISSVIGRGRLRRCRCRMPWRARSREASASRFGDTMMLGGLRSRWMTSFSCAASSPRAILFEQGRASPRGMAPRAIRSASVSPSTSSMTRKRWDSDSSMPWMVAMLG